MLPLLQLASALSLPSASSRKAQTASTRLPPSLRARFLLNNDSFGFPQCLSAYRHGVIPRAKHLSFDAHNESMLIGLLPLQGPLCCCTSLTCSRGPALLILRCPCCLWRACSQRAEFYGLGVRHYSAYDFDASGLQSKVLLAAVVDSELACSAVPVAGAVVVTRPYPS